MPTKMYGFSAAEYALLRRLDTPQKVQRFMEKQFRYNKEKAGETCRSPKQVLKRKEAHCIEGALFAAACFRIAGRKPWIVDLAADRDHDHVITVFKQNGLWGAVSFSQFNSLQWRDPVYKTLRELALSYFPFYYNYSGSKTLKTFSVAVDLSKFDNIMWMTSAENLWDIGNYLFTVKHCPLYPAKARKNILAMDRSIMAFDRKRIKR